MCDGNVELFTSWKQAVDKENSLYRDVSVHRNIIRKCLSDFSAREINFKKINWIKFANIGCRLKEESRYFQVLALIFRIQIC
jgi:hypothetical protein